MTATCTLCGVLLNAAEDPVFDNTREDRIFSNLGNQYRKHMAQYHANEPQTAVEGQLPPNTPIGQMFAFMGATYQVSILMSYLKSEDPVFNKKIQEMKEILEKAMRQKEMKPQVVVLG